MGPTSRLGSSILVAKGFAGCAAWVAACGAVLGQAAQNFDLQTTPLGMVPTMSAVADQDGDGKLDALMLNMASNSTIYILYGDGLGGFAAPKAITLGSGVLAYECADVNRDGKADLVAGLVTPSAGALGSYLSTGTTGFTPGVPAALPAPVKCIKVGDLNLDGNVDAVVTVGSSSTTAAQMFVFLGDGSGAFPTMSAMMNNEDQPSIGDLNGDGKPDIVCFSTSASALHSWLGAGDGTFAYAGNSAPTYSPFGVLLADFNEDSVLDAALCPIFSPNLEMHVGSGSGIFGSLIMSNGLGGFAPVAAADMNGDGHVDIAGKFGAAALGYASGNGQGVVYSASTVVIGAFFLTGVFADLNDDGRCDMLGTAAVPNVLGVAMNFSPYPGLTRYGPGTAGCKGAHIIDGNARPRIGTNGFQIRCNRAPANSLGQGVLSDVQDAAGTDLFSVAAMVHVGMPPIANIVPFDITSGSSGWASFSAPIPNLAMLIGQKYYAQVFWQWPQPCGTAPMGFSSTQGLEITILASQPMPAPKFANVAQYATGAGPTHVRAADVNGDGRPDLAVTCSGASQVSLLLGGANGAFLPALNSPTGAYPACSAFGNFDGDANFDLATADRDSNTVTVSTGNGDGTFTAVGTYPVGLAPIWIESADIDGDGRADLVAVNRDSSTVTPLLGRPGAMFQLLPSVVTVPSPRKVAIADEDLDGFLDLYVVGPSMNAVAFMRGDGHGGFTLSGGIAVGAGPQDMVVADLDADGKKDVAVYESSASTLSIYMKSAPGQYALGTVLIAGASGAGLAAGMINNDCYTDLLMTLPAANGMQIFPGLNFGTWDVATLYPAGMAPASLWAGDLDGDCRADVVTANFASNDVSVMIQ